MIRDAFNDVYVKFKMHFYREVFKKWQDREASLTTVETFCMEVIYALDRPTITEFSEFANLSSSNAADKVNNLIRKGYINKVQSKEDKRIYYLEVTDKYKDYYNISYQYLNTVMERVSEKFTPEELVTMEKILRVMSEELMA
ncbi:MAG: MarR family transcriptional regulator [Pseudobutyrivibrio sp.]|nr:MarR family transcriptional regulator [Pseudobutyrivibrio sp.]